MSRSTTQQVFVAQERRDPTVTDDESLGFLVGSTWLNLLTSATFTCRNPRAGAAWWFDPDAVVTTASFQFAVVDEDVEQAAAAVGDKPWLTQWDDNLYMRVETTTAETIGKMVYVSGSSGVLGTPARVADPSDINTMPAVGLVVDKFTDTLGIAQKMGHISGVFGGLTPQETYLVAADGSVTADASSVPLVQNIGVAISFDTMQLLPQLNMTKRF